MNLLAKKRDTTRPDACLLGQHLADTHDAARLILAATAAPQLEALGLPAGRFRERFERLVLAAAVLHDLGKANDQFQTMIGQAASFPQRVRHEWVTFFMLGQPGWREWLTPALSEPAEYDLLRWCVASHHLKTECQIRADGAPPKLHLLQDGEDFKNILGLVAQRLRLGVPPNTQRETKRVDDVLTACKSVYKAWPGADRETQRLLAAAKATLIAADVSASASAAQDVPLASIGQWLSITPTRGEYQSLVADRLGTHTLLAFQEIGGTSTERVTLVKAGCGSGKTLLAYHWAANRVPVRRLYMCYPTTGTATEGFGDYLTHTVDNKVRVKADARLFHSRAEVDLQRILRVDSEDDDEAAKIASLDAWSTPIVVATVDTVLGLIGSQRRAMYGWPALCQAAFCFDEIHSYDNRLFGALLRFLQDVPGVPVLLMTASLPEPKLRAIEDALARQHECLRNVSGPADLEEAPRYHRLRPGDVADAVRDELRYGGKVLWVCNTVGRAMDVYEKLLDQRPMLYHSRYRYIDRTGRHADAIHAFAGNGPAFVIATQVAEMSLDLSATLLVSDLAPIPSLIQRLGRLNRRAKGNNEKTMPFVVIEPDGESSAKWFPYNTKADQYGDWPAVTHAWIERLGDGPLSQKRLADAWDSSLDPDNIYPLDSTWLDHRTSRPAAVREDSIGVSVLLEEDRIAASNRQRFVESLIPMNAPRRKNWRAPPPVRGVSVAAADEIRYDTLRGAAWAK